MMLRAMIKNWVDNGCSKILTPRAEGQSIPKANVTHSKEFFKSVIDINFYARPALAKIFSKLDKQAVLNAIETEMQTKIIPDQILLHLNEPNLLPNLAEVLEFLQTQLPELPVMIATSLSEYRFTLRCSPDKTVYFVGNSLNCTTKDKFPGHEICSQLDERECNFFDDFAKAKADAIKISYNIHRLNDELTGPAKADAPNIKPFCYHQPIFEMVAGKCTRVFLPKKLNERLNTTSEYEEYNYATIRYEGLTSYERTYAQAINFWNEPNKKQAIVDAATTTLNAATAAFTFSK